MWKENTEGNTSLRENCFEGVMEVGATLKRVELCGGGQEIGTVNINKS